MPRVRECDHGAVASLADTGSVASYPGSKKRALNTFLDTRAIRIARWAPRQDMTIRIQERTRPCNVKRSILEAMGLPLSVSLCFVFLPPTFHTKRARNRSFTASEGGGKGSATLHPTDRDLAG